MDNQIVAMRLLVVSRDVEVLRVISAAAELNLWQLNVASSAWDAVEKLQSDLAVDVLLIDMPSDNLEGFRWLRWLRQLRSTTPILLIDRSNLRELKQLVKRFLIAGGTPLEAKTILLNQSNDAVNAVQSEERGARPVDISAPEVITDIRGYKSLRSIVRSVREEAERSAIASALEQTGWNRKAAARLLKVSYRSILYKIEQYQMNAPDREAALAAGRFSLENRSETGEAKAHWA
jgi:DNA-binding NtrC family response regulator